MTNNSPRFKEGFLIVASCHAFYKNSALQLIDSLDEFYPECKIMVVCPPQWEKEFRIYKQVVEVRTDGPDERRTKLWGLQHTIFEKTCYLDADMHVVSDEIKRVWDLLDDNHDCAFTVINPPNGNSTAIYKEEGDREIRDNKVEKHLRYHGGFFLWWNNDKHPNAKKAMELWWSKWIEINKSDEFWVNNPQYFYKNRSWDQFTWWYIHMRLITDLKIQEVEGGPCPEMYRWNWSPYLFKEITKDLPPIIKHLVILREPMNNRVDLLTGNNNWAG